MSATTAPEAAPPETFEWCPADLIRRRPQPPQDAGRCSAFALLVLNQPVHTHLGTVRRLWENAQFRIAADGGANGLYDAAVQQGDHSFDDLGVIIGDLDSLAPAARSYFESGRGQTKVIQDPSQESTDFGKAVAYIREAHGTAAPRLDIVALGGLGGRVDQGLSQLHHLYAFQPGADYAEGRMYLVSRESLTFLLKPGRHRIRVRGDDDEDADDVFGKHVGIVPVGGPSRITTRGLEWDVRDWATEFGGRMSTSNHVLPATRVVEVETTREVLFTIALRGVQDA